MIQSRIVNLQIVADAPRVLLLPSAPNRTTVMFLPSVPPPTTEPEALSTADYKVVVQGPTGNISALMITAATGPITLSAADFGSLVTGAWYVEAEVDTYAIAIEALSL